MFIIIFLVVVTTLNFTTQINQILKLHVQILMFGRSLLRLFSIAWNGRINPF